MLYPAAQKHGQITQFKPNIYWVKGSVALKAPHPKFGPLTLRFSRNMCIIKQGESLTLVNSVRLNDSMLAELDKLGTVKHVIRLAAFHGMDDPFYKDRYNTDLWSVDAPYFRGVDPNKPENIYLQPDHILKSGSDLPVEDSEYFEIDSGTLNEGLLRIKREDGIVISGDSLQNWLAPDEYFNLSARLMMSKMGFIRECGIGPGWIQATKPDLTTILPFLEQSFECLIPSHGELVKSRASEKFKRSIHKIIQT